MPPDYISFGGPTQAKDANQEHSFVREAAGGVVERDVEMTRQMKTVNEGLRIRRGSNPPATLKDGARLGTPSLKIGEGHMGEGNRG